VLGGFVSAWIGSFSGEFPKPHWFTGPGHALGRFVGLRSFRLVNRDSLAGSRSGSMDYAS